MRSRVPTLAEVLNAAIKRGAAELRVALPGKILKFDPATQLAEVRPLLRESYEREDGTEGTEALPVVPDVPVQFPGAGGFVVTFPVKAGDPCWLVFADRSLDRWIATGNEVDPVDVRRHHLTDAVALLGVRSRAGALAEFDASNLRVGSVGGVGVTVKEGTVEIGGTHNELLTQAALHGTYYRAQEATLHAALTGALSALATALGAAGAGLIAAAADPLFSVPTPVAAGGVATAGGGLEAAAGSIAPAIAAINAFEAGDTAPPGYLSDVVKLK